MAHRTTEEKQNPTEDDIRTRLKELSAPMLQTEYLENLLKRIAIQPSIKVYASKALADLHIRRGLWGSAAKTLENAADAATVFSEKKSLYLSVGTLHIKAMDYLLADDAFRKAVDSASPGEKAKLAGDIRGLFLREAQELEKDNKTAKALKLYERILRTAVGEEKRKVMERLMVLYEKLARIPDFMAMRDSLKNFK